VGWLSFFLELFADLYNVYIFLLYVPHPLILVIRLTYTPLHTIISIMHHHTVILAQAAYLMIKRHYIN